MWFRRRPAFDEKALAAFIRQTVKEALTEQRPGDTLALAQLLEGLYAKQMESFAKNAEAMGGFLGVIGELGIKRAAVALGSRGGKARAARAADAPKPQMAASGECAVCIDPNCKDSLSIVRHVNEGHDARRAAAAKPSRFGNATAEEIAAHQAFVGNRGN